MPLARIVKWAGIGLAMVFVGLALLVGGLFAFSSSLAGTVLPPLQLAPLSSVPPSTNPGVADGTWVVRDGSFAGFRVGVGLRSTIVGRTSAVRGSLVTSGNTITSSSFDIDLRQVTIGGKPNVSFYRLLEISAYPSAVMTLSQPVILPGIPAAGQTIELQTPATLTIHGLTHTVMLTITARANGPLLDAAGSAPLLDSDWKVASPFGVNHAALIEFLVILQPR